MPDLTDLRQADLDAICSFLLDTASELGDYADAYGEYFSKAELGGSDKLSDLYQRTWDLYQEVDYEKRRRMKTNE